MELLEFENTVMLKHSDWTLSKSRSGAALWIDIVTPKNLGFTIQVTPNDGIGVSRRFGDELDFGGHDEVFSDLGEVLWFLESHVDENGEGAEKRGRRESLTRRESSTRIRPKA